MPGRWIIYLLTLLGSVVFYGFYKEWFSFIWLQAVVFLPWLSLILSLPAMLTVKAEMRCAEKTVLGMPVRISMTLSGKFPVPPVRCTLRLANSLSGERFLGQPGELIPTKHCGKLTVTYPRMYAYDYLGLFFRRLHRQDSCYVYVEPRPVEAEKLPDTQGGQSVGWKPKPGGGFSEVHDLRLYRPGDDLRHIHWKMAAKTGKLIYREPMEPVEKGYVLTLSLFGTPDELDQRLGQLVYMSRRLLEQGLDHRVYCLTGAGVADFSVKDETTLEAGIHILLSSPPAEADTAPKAGNVLWQHRIGGDGHDA